MLFFQLLGYSPGACQKTSGSKVSIMYNIAINRKGLPL